MFALVQGRRTISNKHNKCFIWGMSVICALGKIKQQDEGLEVKLGEQVTSLNPGLRRRCPLSKDLKERGSEGKSIPRSGDTQLEGSPVGEQPSRGPMGKPERKLARGPDRGSPGAWGAGGAANSGTSRLDP